MVWSIPGPSSGLRPWSRSPSEHCKPYARRIFCVWSALFWIWSRRPILPRIVRLEALLSLYTQELQQSIWCGSPRNLPNNCFNPTPHPRVHPPGPYASPPITLYAPPLPHPYHLGYHSGQKYYKRIRRNNCFCNSFCNYCEINSGQRFIL